MFTHIDYEVSGCVAVITLNEPDKMNVLGIGPGSNRDEIARALVHADGDDGVGSVVIVANGKAFCAGGDLGGAKKTETPLDEHLFSEQMLAFFSAFRAMHKPVIAGVNGLCLGSAMGMIAQCDLVIAADDTRFGLIEGRIGHPGASELVPIIGAQWTKFMILTGELITAETARDIGLVLSVERAEELHARVMELAGRIASLPMEGVLLNKACIDAMTDVMGRVAGRLVGRAIDTTTKGMAKYARAPDGRRFAEIFAAEGAAGLKAARDQQFKGTWLRNRKFSER